MIVELLSVLTIFIGGCALTRVTGLKGWPLPAIGFAAGVALLVIIGTLQAITALPTSPVLALVLTFLLPVAWWFRAFLSGQEVSIKPIPTIITLFIFILASLVLRNIVSVTPDSFQYVTIGSLLESGNFSEASPLILLKRFIAVPILHSPANLAEGFYIRSITPLLALSLLICLVWFINKGLSVSLKDPVIISLFTTAAVLLLVTNNRFVFNMFYINSHMLVALFLLLLVGSGWLLLRQADVPQQTLIMLQVISIPVLTLARPEASIYAGIALIPILIAERVSLKNRMLLLLVLGVSVISWHGFLWIKYDADGSDVPFSVLAMLAYGILVIIITPLLAWKPLYKLIPYSVVLTESGLWLALLVMVYINPSIFHRSVLATIENVILDAGGWGVSLAFIGFIVLGVLVFSQVPDRLILRFPLTTFIPLSLLLAYLRSGAYRVGHGDSLNRMFIHILPLAVLFIVSSAATVQFSLPEELRKYWLLLVTRINKYKYIFAKNNL